MRGAIAIVLTAFAPPALAHSDAPVQPGALLEAWTPDPFVGLALAIVALLYGRGLVRLWARAGAGRGVVRWEAMAFWLGIAILALALLSPLDTLTGTLLSAHMAQHVLLIALAPPLLLLGRPDAVLTFSLSEPARHGISRNVAFRAILGTLRRMARPLPSTLLHALAMWVWHAPGPFQAALDNSLLHDLEHASFLVTALLFWQGVVEALRNPRWRIAAILALLATLIQSGFLGALLTLSGRPLYPAMKTASLWGLTPLQDQQLAGLIMWVPAGAAYILAGLAVGARLIGLDAPARVSVASGKLD